MTLRLLYQYLTSELEDVVTDSWQVADLATSSVSDRLVELVFLDLTYDYQELIEFYCSGRLSLVFYKKFDSNLDSQLNAVETVIEWVKTINLDDVTFGEGESLATVETGIVEGNVPYKVMTISVPFEFIVRDLDEDEG